LSLQETEVPAIQFFPEAGSLDVLHPACADIAGPMITCPLLDGTVSKIAVSTLTFDPFMPQGFRLPLSIDTASGKRLFHYQTLFPIPGLYRDSDDIVFRHERVWCDLPLILPRFPPESEKLYHPNESASRAS